jgi:hypothetical protein
MRKIGAARLRLSARATAKNTRISSHRVMVYLFGFAFMQNEFVILALLQPKTQGYAENRNPILSILAE